MCADNTTIRPPDAASRTGGGKGATAPGAGRSARRSRPRRQLRLAGSGAWAAVPDGGGERLPGSRGEGQDRAVRILAVTDLHVKPGVTGLDAVAAVGRRIAALGPLTSETGFDAVTALTIRVAALRPGEGEGHWVPFLEEVYRIVDKDSGLGRAQRCGLEMVEHQHVPLDVAGLVFDQRTGRAVDTRGDRKSRVTRVEQGERAVVGHVSARTERQDLKCPTRGVGYLAEPLKLAEHHVPAADNTPNDGFVQDYPHLGRWRIGPIQDFLAAHPHLDVPFDLLGGTGGTPGPEHCAGVIRRLPQAGHELRVIAA